MHTLPRHRFAFVVLSAALGLITHGLANAAPSQRTFVASFGSDANPDCSLALPCRSFNAAIAQTLPGGEVVILDTAGYGPMTITQSLKVIGPSGVYGGISVKGGAGPTTGIVINAGDTDDITLRGLDITGVPGVAPLPLIGIDIQNAGAVHIEKSSIGNFPEDGGTCIQLVTAKSVRLYVDDSFLRHCVTGIYANGNTVTSNRSSVIVDNTRIERGFNTNPATPSTGVIAQGFLAATVRNSVVSRQTTAVRLDSNLAGANNTLDIVGSELANNTNGLQVVAGADTGNSLIRIAGTRIVNVVNDAVSIANSALNRNAYVAISDSYVANAPRLVLLSNTSTDTVNARIQLDMDNTRLFNAVSGGVSLDLASPNGAKTRAFVRDSTFASGGTMIRTRGTSAVSVSLIRSALNNCTTILDHGVGVARLQGNFMSTCDNDFVNNGSGNVLSDGRTVVDGIPNTSGFVYITPAPITLK